MQIRFYNTLSRSIQEFQPINPKEVTIYTCGPTVYSFVHIGNFRAFLFYDFLKQALRFLGLNVKHVMNITDVDDKTIKASKAKGQSLKEYTEFYTQEFLKDLATLKIEPPDIMPKATQEIPAMVAMIERLLEKEHAYKNEKGDIYFKISSFPEYGELARLDRQRLRENADGRMNRSDEYDKDDARDFALWKAYDKDDGDVFWESSIGKGRPGWHIECSAMAAKYLGQPFDIHGGGIDLMFPHHENEIAQSTCSCGKPLANFWMHNEHLLVNGKKMSKSLGNFFTLRDLLEKGIDPVVLRYELLKTHYRQQLDFRLDELEASAGIIRKFRDFQSRLSEAGKGKGLNTLDQLCEKTLADFGNALSDDLNISQALAVSFNFMGEVNKGIELLDAGQVEQVQKTWSKLNAVVGVFGPAETEVPTSILELIKAREAARQSKNFALADQIRKQISDLGYEVKDGAGGGRVMKIV